ncbi:MAG: glutamyl-tRNA synthetase [Planctomycetota bacterium]
MGRLAPSPTGVLHLGNARTFLLAWLSVRSRGGTLLLRIEDIDGPRVKAGATEQAIEDLRWLGLDWQGEVLVQSSRRMLYHAAAQRLVGLGLAYPCVCTRKEVDEAASAPHADASAAGSDGPIYPGTCRGRFVSLDDAKQQTGREAALRFRVDACDVPFVDGFRGTQSGAIAGDFVIQKRDGGPAYQLAVVVDDAAQAVTEVLRADDLLPSTPRQLLLYRALGLSEPTFVHVPLLVGTDGLRLAKRHGDTSLRYFRKCGVTAGDLVGYLAKSCGLRDSQSACTMQDLLAEFDLRKLSPSPMRGDDHGLL